MTVQDDITNIRIYLKIILLIYGLAILFLGLSLYTMIIILFY